MNLRRVALLAACIFVFARAAWAHRIDEYLQATILALDAHQVHGSMRLIPGEMVAPSVVSAIDSNHDGILSQGEERAYAQRVLADLSITVDGKAAVPQLRSWSFPEMAEMSAGLGEIHIEYDVELPPGGLNRVLILANHHLNPASVYLMNAELPQDPGIRILAQKRNQQQSVYELDFQQSGGAAGTANPSSGRLHAWLGGLQFAPLFVLGMRHIAEGTDHLLFLLVLLLPAPLLAAGSHWDQPAGFRRSLLHILGIVTAFTIGHSITLTLAAMNVVHVPERPIEVLIAASILISAVHALRPIFPGREAWIAGFFGLIHGLAFAATLDRLGLTHWQRVAGILAFNLGIETMQMLVVVMILPSLLLMSRTRAYSSLRIGGAVFAAIAAVGWIMERLFEIQTPVDTIVNAVARHAVSLAALLCVASLGCRYWALGDIDRPLGKR